MKKLTSNTSKKTEAINADNVERILVVDDHASARDSIAEIFRDRGIHVDTCGSGAEAVNFTGQNDYRCIVSDLQMPGMNGIELMNTLRICGVMAPILLVTAHASVSTAVEAIRQGAFDYIEKPFDIEQLERLVFQAMRLSKSQHAKTNNDTITGVTPVMIGSSKIMQQLRRRIESVASVSETVLISGENGTGKEIVAKTIHFSSNRRDSPWVTLNCPALSPQLMESELFGHIKGAFTGADTERVGRFEAAASGTVLLDEISEIDLPLQSKLLRVLQERSFERVGSSDTIASNARVLATTNRDLHAEINAGRFREDLFYRLAVLPIVVPPLRERKEDIPELFDWFLQQTSNRLGSNPPRFESGVMELLQSYHWPGNVRQLENVVTRASILSDTDSVSADDLRRWLSMGNQDEIQVITGKYTGDNEAVDWHHDRISNENPPGDTVCRFVVGTSLDEIEREMIEATLAHFDGHREKTAKTLGIGVRTLTDKLRRYGYAPREKSRS